MLGKLFTHSEPLRGSKCKFAAVGKSTTKSTGTTSHRIRGRDGDNHRHGRRSGQQSAALDADRRNGDESDRIDAGIGKLAVLVDAVHQRSATDDLIVSLSALFSVLDVV